MNAGLNTLSTALYVVIDNELNNHPEWAPERPTVGIVPKLAAAELLTLPVLRALLGCTSEARLVRYAKTHLTGMPLSAETARLQDTPPSHW